MKDAAWLCSLTQYFSLAKESVRKEYAWYIGHVCGIIISEQSVVCQDLLMEC